MEEGHVESRITLFQGDGCIRIRREANEVLDPSCLAPSGAADQVQQQHCAQRMRSPEDTEWPGYSINRVCLSWWHRHIPRGQCQDSERAVRRAWDIATSVQMLTSLRTFGMCWKTLAEWSDSPPPIIINDLMTLQKLMEKQCQSKCVHN